MTKPLIQIDDLVREMTDEEFAEYETQQAESQRIEAEILAKEEAKASGLAKLQALGLTEEEANALLGA